MLSIQVDGKCPARGVAWLTGIYVMFNAFISNYFYRA